MKRFRGDSLVEILISLCALGVALPAILGSFGMTFSAGLRIGETVDKAWGAEWWFNRVELPALSSAMDDMPRKDASGKLRFRWETRGGEHEPLRVTLFVSNGSDTDVPLVVNRVF
ncbi:MAG: hypothetical protein LBT15_02415 [Synergistaceae bacterium]|jgi:hypothetical protein|nr:hypothetical protein [Synergistaceae bacterium]